MSLRLQPQKKYKSPEHKHALSATCGRLTLLSLALAGAFAAMTPLQGMADTVVIGPQSPIVNNNVTQNITVTGSGLLSGFSTGVANFNSGTIGTLSNDGTILGNRWALTNVTSIGTINNNATGTFNGTTYGIFTGGISGNTYHATIGAINNSGIITGNNFGIYNGSTGSSANIGVIGSLSNSGTISGATGIYNAGASTITALTNSVGGTISGMAGIRNLGLITSLDNNGGLISGGTGIVNNGTIASLTNSGTVSTSAVGILNNALMGTITNTASGVISAAAAGVQNAVGTISTLSNSGKISGVTGVFGNSGTIGTILNSGTIQGSLYAINISSGASLGGLANSGTIAGVIQDLDTAALTISGGSGSTFGTLTGYNGATGNIVAANGLVFSGGNQLLNSNISVNSGNGTVTNAAGLLQINNQLTINGSYYQNAAATLAIGISANAGSLGTITDTGYGRLLVAGNATIESGSSVMLKPLTTYSYAAGQRFVIIQAAGNSNNFNAASLNYSVTGYLASGADVTETINATTYHNLVVTIANVNSGATHGNTATNGNANAVLRGLFNYAGLNQGLLDVYNPALAISNPDQANRAGAQLSPTATAGAVVGAATTAFGAVQGAAGSRIDTVRTAQAGGSGVATGETTLDPALWGRLFGGQANQGARDGISGYHASYGGFILGGDVQALPDWRIGGLFSYARSNIGNDGDNSGSGAHVDSYGLTAYAGYDGRPWYVNLTAGVARQMVGTNRAISYTGFSGTANGSFKGNLFTASAQAGYPLAIGNATLTPLAGVRYTSLRQDGYTETGGSGAALRVNGSTYSSFKSELGAKYEHSLMTSYGSLKPFLQLSWNHEFRNTPLATSASFAADSSGSTSFTTQGAGPLRNTTALSLGATLLRSKNLTLVARYTLEGAKGYTAQTSDVTLRWQY